MKKNQISTAIKFAMGVSAFDAFMPLAGVAYAQDDSADVDEVIVTGSRIKRTTNTDSQSIITISAEDM